MGRPLQIMTAAKVMSFLTHCQRVFKGLIPLLSCSLIWCCSGNKGFTQTNPRPLIPGIQSISGQQTTDLLIAFDSRIEWHKLQIPVLKEDKARFVYHRLRIEAESSQRAVRAFLQKHGVPYTAYYVVNAIHAQVPNLYLDDLTQLEGVSQIAINSPFEQEYSFIEEIPIRTRNAQPEWGILRIKADSVWAMGITGQGVIIAGEDTGFDWDHPALRRSYRGTEGDTVLHRYNWHDAIHEINPLNGDTIIDPTNNPCGLSSPVPCDDNGHGTHTMGTMVGEDGPLQIGVAPGAKWIACRNMERGWGSPATYLECMEWFLAPTDEQGEDPDPTKSPHVINNSWSCPEVEGCNPQNFDLLRQAVVNLRAAGIVVVVSAGNSGSGCESVSAPLAIFEESFTVGAINFNDTIAGFSSRGPVTVDSSMRIKPNVCAPGVQVLSSWIGDTYLPASGTSMSGPHVAGVVALMISANPQLAGQVEVIESIIETTARPKTTTQDCGNLSGVEPLNNTFGYGIVDALAAVQAALLISSTDDDIIADSPLTFYPNPVRSVLQITGEEHATIASFRIIAPDGRVVYVARDLALPAQVDMRTLPQGLYFVQADHYSPIIIHVIE